MASCIQTTYAPEVERLLRQYYQTLSEKNRRHFAAVEAITLGYGGISYIANVLGCSRRTVARGIHELKQLPDDTAGKYRIRRPGGGRKLAEEKNPHLLSALKQIALGHMT
jgi:hypothetical protein